MVDDPEVFVALHNPTGLRLFGYRQPPDYITAPDRGRFSTLLDIDPIEFNSAPLTGDLFGGAMAVERPQTRCTFSNLDGFWSVLAGSEVLLHQAMAIHLFYAQQQMHEFFRGEVLAFYPEKDTCVVEFGEGGALYDTIKLLRADRFPRPRNRADILPVVYGRFIGAGVNTDNEDSGGATPAVCVDIDRNIYLLSATRCDATPPQVYVNNTPQAATTSTGEPIYTYYPDADFFGDGYRAAYLEFHLNVSGDVSVRMNGTIDGATGLLITNPIVALQHFLTNFAQWAITDFDPYTTLRTQQQLEIKGYTVHWCFNQDRNAKEWLVDFFRHYWVSHFVTANATLGLSYDQIPTPPEAILAYLDARKDFGGDDPERAVRPLVDSRNLTNHITLKARGQWHTGDFTGEIVVEDQASIRMHGGRPKKYIAELPGIRTVDHAVGWISQLQNRTTFLPTEIEMTIRHLGYPFLLPSAYHTLAWRYALSGVEGGWGETTPGIMLVRNSRIVLPNPYTGRHGEMTIRSIYTGSQFRRTTYAVLVDNLGTPWYLYVNTAGVLSLDPGIPAMDPLNTTPWRFISRVSPDTTTWYIYPQVNDDGTGLELQISDTSPGGTGSADQTMEFITRWYQSYKVRVGDGGILITTMF
jgi:hypothetical protein